MRMQPLCVYIDGICKEPRTSLILFFQEMEEKKRLTKSMALASMMTLLVIWFSMVPAVLGCQLTKDRSGCKGCVADQMKYGCPSCVPLLHCMARCLWGGTSRTSCTQKCDCNGGKPKLSDCKKCMSRCKCSCVA